MNKYTALCATFTAFLSLFFLSSKTNAQDLTWDGGPAGDWSTFDNNWRIGAVGGLPWLDNANAVFANPGTTTVSIAPLTTFVRAGSLTVFQEGLTIDGGALILDNAVGVNPSLQMFAPVDAVFTIDTLAFEAGILNADIGLANTAIIHPSMITPADTFIIKKGDGTLVLTGDLNSGEIAVNRGILQLGDGASFTTGQNPDATIAAGASIILNGGAAHETGLGFIEGDGTLIKRGPGSLRTSSGSVRPLATSPSFVLEEGRLEVQHVDGASILGRDATIVDGTQVAFLGAQADDAVIGPAPPFIPNNNAALLSITLSGDGIVGSRGAMRLRGTQIYSALTLAADATIQNAGGPDADVYGAIDGPGGLTKIGNGVLTLHSDNTYAGPTIIEKGTLRITAAGGFGNSPSLHIDAGVTVEVDSAAMTPVPNGAVTDLHFSNLPSQITGSGSLALTNIPAVDGGGTPIGGAFFDLQPDSTIAPGNSPGTLAFMNDVNWAGNYLWELEDATGGAGTDWDLVTAFGHDIDLAAGGTLSILDFNNSLPTLNLTPNAVTDFEIFIADNILNFNAGTFTINPGHFLEAHGTTDLLVNGFGNALLLRFTANGAAIPEPGTVVLLGMLFIGVVAYSRNKRHTTGEQA